MNLIWQTSLMALLSLALSVAAETTPALTPASTPEARCRFALSQAVLPLAPGEDGFRVVHVDEDETPDAAKPLRVRRPDGVFVYLQGFSGHKVLVAERLEDLANRENRKVDLIKVRLFNAHGVPYGEEGLPYASGSSGWDLSFAKRTIDGSESYLIYAGVMGDHPDGRPLTMADKGNWTRERRAFEMRMRLENGQLIIEGHSPRQIVPMDRSTFTWRGHHYGGGPTLLENGEAYINERGHHEMDHEMVVDESWRVNENGNSYRLPQRTVIVRTELDETLTHAVDGTVPEIVLDLTGPDGKPYPSSVRPDQTFLIEGPQTQVLIDGVPAQSNAHVRIARAEGKLITKRILFSSGQYFRRYGGNLAYSDKESGDYRAVLDDAGTDLYDILKPFRHFMIGGGRLVAYRDERGRDVLTGHAFLPHLRPDRPFLVDDEEGAPQLHPNFVNFCRLPFSSPVRWVPRAGGDVPKFLDNTGCLGHLLSGAESQP